MTQPTLPLPLRLETLLQQLPMARTAPPDPQRLEPVPAPELEGRTFLIRVPAGPVEPEPAEYLELGAVARERLEGEPLEDGDLVELRWWGRLEGSDKPLIAEESLQVRLAPDMEPPGLYETLQGLVAGMEASFEGALPEEFPVEEARGRKVHFEVHVLRAWEEPPRARMPPHVRRRARQQVLGELAGEVGAALPEEWVQAELRSEWELAQRVAQASGGSAPPLEVYLEQAERRSEAERRLRLELVLQAFCRREQLEPGEAGLEELLYTLAERLGGQVDEVVTALEERPDLVEQVGRAAWFLQAVEAVMEQVELRLSEG